jgi:hypothetical protein
VKDLETVFLNSLIANQEHIPIEYGRLVSLSPPLRSLGSFASACSASAVTEKSTGSSKLWSGDQTYRQPRTESLYRLVCRQTFDALCRVTLVDRGLFVSSLPVCLGRLLVRNRYSSPTSDGRGRTCRPLCG